MMSRVMIQPVRFTMSVLGIALVIAAAFCHATWNFFVKRINAGPELIWLFSAVTLVVYFPFAMWVLIREHPTFDSVTTAFFLGSIVLHLGYFLLLQTGYRNGDLSLVYPTARATGPMLSTFFAVLFLGETISLQMGIGALVIVFGVLMLTGGIRPGAKNVTKSLLFGLGAGGIIGSYTAWDAYAVSILMAPPLLLDYASSAGRVLLLAPLARRKSDLVLHHWRHHRTAVVIIAVFNPLAYILVLIALQFTPVAYVAPLRELSVLLSVIAGSVLLKEGQLSNRLAWAVVIVVGMIILVSS